MRFHWHHDPDWKIDGVWAYHVCRRCGARRIVWAVRGLMGPCRPGWGHLTVDKHGRHLADSGWVIPPGPSAPTERGQA